MKQLIQEILRMKLLEDKDMYQAIEIQAPNKLKFKHNYKTIFLAGSIEGNDAQLWQERIIKSVPSKPLIFFNPRRDDYDTSLTQDISNSQFKEQVTWELEALEASDYIIMYFDPKTKSPISLLELGLHANSKKMIVCCPDGFWRKGNVDIVCEVYKIKQVSSLDDLIDMLTNDKLNEKIKGK